MTISFLFVINDLTSVENFARKCEFGRQFGAVIEKYSDLFFLYIKDRILKQKGRGQQ
jgi:hypothetical protein